MHGGLAAVPVRRPRQGEIIMASWIFLTMAISAITAVGSVLLMRWSDGRHVGEMSERDVLRERLRQLERKATDGSIDAKQAETAAREIKRRMLIEKRAKGSRLRAQRSAPVQGRPAMIAAAAVASLSMVALYFLTDRFDFASVDPSNAGAGAPGPNAVEQLAALTNGQTLADQFATQSQAGLPSVDEMIERLVLRLQRNPDDPEGWRILGWSYAATERFADAAAAYAKAIDLRPTVADLRSSRAEALVRAANGSVTNEARRSFEEALRLDSRDPRARFLAGLAKEQAGDKVSALEDWIVILNDTDPNEPSLSDIRQRAIALGGELGVDVSKRLQRAQSAALGDPPQSRDRAPEGSGPGGPSAEDVRNAEAMLPAEREAMIQDMVDGLARRLEQQPRNGAGWIKLIRSRLVLGQAEEAKRALERALEVFADTPEERDRITATVRDFGLAP